MIIVAIIAIVAVFLVALKWAQAEDRKQRDRMDTIRDLMRRKDDSDDD